MSASTAFNVAREIGTNLSGAFNKVRDENAIESILSQAMQTGDPAILQDSIGKILSQVSPERQGPAIQYLQNAYANVKSKQQQIANRQGIISAGLTPDLPESLQKVQYEHNLANQQAQGIIRNQGVSIGGQPNVAPSGAMSQSGAEQPAPPTTQGIQYKDLSDEQLVQLRGVKGFEKQADSELKRRQEEGKKKQPGDEFKNIREKAVSEYVNNAIAQRDEAENLKYSLATVRKAINGNITGPGLAAVAKNNPYTQLLVGLTPDEALLQSANKKLLQGTKGIFGPKPTEREIFLLLNSMLPSIGKTKEANLAGLEFIDKVNDMILLHSEMVDRLTEGGTKYVANLEKQVADLTRPFAEKIRDELQSAVDRFGVAQGDQEKPATSKKGEIKVKAPNGTIGYMTQENIDKAKAQNVIFTPTK